MKPGKIITLSGIAGAGKSYLKKDIIERNPNLFAAWFSITTRAKCLNEDYTIFCSLKEFIKKSDAGELCFINEVYGNLYAYKKSQLRLCKMGVNLIAEIFYKDVLKFKSEFPNALSVYVLPSDIETTKAKLKARELEVDDLNKRLKDINDALAFFYRNRKIFDLLIINKYTKKTCLSFQDSVLKLVM